MSSRTMLGIIAAFAGGTALAACGGDDPKDGSRSSGATGGSEAGAAATAAAGEKLAKDQVVTIALEVEPNTLDLNKDLYALAGSGMAPELAGLLQFDEHFNVQPDMAESFTVNAAGDVYTFKMRRETKWSNGDPVTARDFEWSWKRNLDPATAASYAGFLFDIKGAERFNAKLGTARTPPPSSATALQADEVGEGAVT